jgi:hypothetical protein
MILINISNVFLYYILYILYILLKYYKFSYPKTLPASLNWIKGTIYFIKFILTYLSNSVNIFYKLTLFFIIFLLHALYALS